MSAALHDDTSYLVRHGDYLLRQWGAWAASGHEARRLGYPRSTLFVRKAADRTDLSAGADVDKVLQRLSREMVRLAVLHYQKRCSVKAARSDMGLSHACYCSLLKALRIAVFIGCNPAIEKKC